MTYTTTHTYDGRLVLVVAEPGNELNYKAADEAMRLGATFVVQLPAGADWLAANTIGSTSN